MRSLKYYFSQFLDFKTKPIARPATQGTRAAPIITMLTTQFFASPNTISDSSPIFGSAEEGQAMTVPNEKAPKVAKNSDFGYLRLGLNKFIERDLLWLPETVV